MYDRKCYNSIKWTDFKRFRTAFFDKEMADD